MKCIRTGIEWFSDFRGDCGKDVELFTGDNLKMLRCPYSGIEVESSDEIIHVSDVCSACKIAMILPNTERDLFKAMRKRLDPSILDDAVSSFAFLCARSIEWNNPAMMHKGLSWIAERYLISAGMASKMTMK